MNATTAATKTYYRTAAGSRRHSSWYCANSRRSITRGGVTEIPAGEVKDWAPCGHCCKAEVTEARAAKAAAKQANPNQCPNEGVRKPRHIQSECKSCGKRGTVDRRTGALRPHLRAA